MKLLLTDCELEILAFMHEHATGFTPDHGFDISAIQEQVDRMQDVGFSTALHYLMGLKLILPATTPGCPAEVCLTMKGEECIRLIELSFRHRGLLSLRDGFTYAYLSTLDEGTREYVVKSALNILAGMRGGDRDRTARQVGREPEYRDQDKDASIPAAL